MLYVAEVGSNHKGSKALAFEYIRQFSQAGANVIKFQFGWTHKAQKKAGVEYNPIRHIDEWSQDLMKWCRLYGVELLASIWSEEGLATARAVGMSRYKISSQVWKLDPKLSKLILQDEITTFVSGYVEPSDFVYPIHAVSKYPTYPGEIDMPRSFGTKSCYYGYSDHAHGIGACLLAVARGAKYIEKHVCLDRELVTRDAAFAATPDDFKTLVYAGEEMRRHL
jgi:sialic acid synthase SpsE